MVVAGKCHCYCHRDITSGDRTQYGRGLSYRLIKSGARQSEPVFHLLLCGGSTSPLVVTMSFQFKSLNAPGSTFNVVYGNQHNYAGFEGALLHPTLLRQLLEVRLLGIHSTYKNPLPLEAA